MKSAIGLAVLIATVGTVSGCSGDSSSSVLPTTPSVPQTVETFSGTVPILGNESHAFTVTQQGEIDITLTAAGPPSTITMGLAIGNPPAATSSTCLPLSSGTISAQGGTTPQLTGTVAAGLYCVLVFDIGNETEPAMYTVSVKHP